MSIAQRLAHIRHQIPASVRLVAVTKQVSVDAIKEAYDAGVRDFAESRLQEALAKQEQLQDYDDICWHFIGHIQTNKAKKVLNHFQWIHSVDSLKLAQRLNTLAGESSVTPHVFLQVKSLPDPDKYGWQIQELWEELPQLETCQHLNIEGLMTILPLGLSETETLEAFETIKNLAHSLTEKSSFNLTQLSMGMSSDYLLAVQRGATMIRLGRIIFGERDK